MAERSVHVLVDRAVLFVEHTVPLGEQETHKLHVQAGRTRRGGEGGEREK